MMFNVVPLTRPAESQLIQKVQITPVEDFALGTAIKSKESTWSMLQVIAAALGGFLIVLGGIVIAATGVTEWTDSTATVWGFTQTPLLAAAGIVLGLFLLASSASVKATRAALIGFGALMAAFGAIVLLQPGMFDDIFGANREVGVLYAASGASSVFLGSLVR